MAYSRWTECNWYIFGCDENDGVMFQARDGTSDKYIPGDAVDIFIYKLFNKSEGGGEDFWERYNRGKQLIEQNNKSSDLKNSAPHLG